MIYSFKCNNIDCTNRNKEIDISLPMTDASKEQFCENCKEQLQKIFVIGGHQTFSDGYKG